MKCTVQFSVILCVQSVRRTNEAQRNTAKVRALGGIVKHLKIVFPLDIIGMVQCVLIRRTVQDVIRQMICPRRAVVRHRRDVSCFLCGENISQFSGYCAPHEHFLHRARSARDGLPFY